MAAANAHRPVDAYSLDDEDPLLLNAREHAKLAVVDAKTNPYYAAGQARRQVFLLIGVNAETHKRALVTHAFFMQKGGDSKAVANNVWFADNWTHLAKKLKRPGSADALYVKRKREPILKNIVFQVLSLSPRRWFEAVHTSDECTYCVLRGLPASARVNTCCRIPKTRIQKRFRFS